MIAPLLGLPNVLHPQDPIPFRRFRQSHIVVDENLVAGFDVAETGDGADQPESGMFEDGPMGVRRERMVSFVSEGGAVSFRANAVVRNVEIVVGV